MTAKEFLSQAWKIDRRIEKKIEERERLNTKLTAGRMASFSGMPRGGKFDWTDAIAKLIELDDVIKGEIMELCRIKREVITAINTVESARCRSVLELRYRNCMSWEAIADYLGYEESTVYKIHKDGLEAVRVPGRLTRRLQ